MEGVQRAVLFWEGAGQVACREQESVKDTNLCSPGTQGQHAPHRQIKLNLSYPDPLSQQLLPPGLLLLLCPPSWWLAPPSITAYPILQNWPWLQLPLRPASHPMPHPN